MTGLIGGPDPDMPIYEYQCQQCQHHLEQLQRMSDDPLTDCPACGKPSLRRLISAAAFRLKGGGWYETDFKQGDKRNLADTGKEKPPEPAAKTETTEKKPAKSESKPAGTTSGDAA
jgi:putative FmdB family regulatory protein